MIGGIAIPIGLIWFAWTNSPSIHWMASIAAGVPFGFGMVMVFLGIMNYLIDAYTIFAASVLAANSVLRSIFGAVFPLFTQQMIRKSCKYAAEAEAFLRRMQEDMEKKEGDDEGSSDADTAVVSPHEQEEKEKDAEREREEEEQEAIDYSYEEEHDPAGGRFEKIKTNQPRPVLAKRATSYDANPFDLDRVNTRESFRSEKRSLERTNSRRPSGVGLSRASSRTSRR
ncbi:hypothetical protein LTR81_017697 [Elasticomyces elasticus]